jgi:hypothetical protein
MGQQEVQEWAEYAHLWGPCVKDQCSGGVVAYLHPLGAARQEVQDPVVQAGLRPRAPSFMMSLEGTMVLKAEL